MYLASLVVCFFYCIGELFFSYIKDMAQSETVPPVMAQSLNGLYSQTHFRPILTYKKVAIDRRNTHFYYKTILPETLFFYLL